MLSKSYISCFLILFFSTTIWSQDLLKGVVKDATTLEPLAFATIQFGVDKGVISNEDGEFSIPWNERIVKLSISYVGYQTIDYPITEPNENIEFLLQTSSTSISEVIVKAKDLYASNILFKSIKKSRKDAKKKRTAKLFRRSYSYRADAPSEYMEAFYNVKTRDGGIDFFDLKNGRYGIPRENYFINTELTNLLQMHKLFTREFSDLPGSPLDYKSLKKIRKDFDVRIRKKYTIEKDTILEIHFEPLRKKDILFAGEVWVKKSNLKIEKVTLHIEDTDRNPFITIINPKRNKVAKLDLNLNIGFKYIEEELVFDYFQIEEKKLIKSPNISFEVVTNSKLFFYDYEQPFQLPFFSDIAEAYHDYEKILFFSYDQDFWKRNYLIAETAEERKFRNELEANQLFKNQTEEQAIVIRRRFEPWSSDWKISPDLVAKRETRRGHEQDEVVYVNQKNPNPRNNLFGSTFISLDYECYPDTIIFKTEAVIDYRFSFSTYRRDIDFKYLENFLHLAKIHANEFQLALVQNFKNKKDCPDRATLKEMLSDANEILQKENKKYKFKCHLYREDYKIKEYTEEIKKRLEESFTSLNN